MHDPETPYRPFDYIDDGPAIYVDSFATIRAETDLAQIPADAEKVAVRMVHACLTFSNPRSGRGPGLAEHLLARLSGTNK